MGSAAAGLEEACSTKTAATTAAQPKILVDFRIIHPPAHTGLLSASKSQANYETVPNDHSKLPMCWSSAHFRRETPFSDIAERIAFLLRLHRSLNLCASLQRLSSRAPAPRQARSFGEGSCLRFHPPHRVHDGPAYAGLRILQRRGNRRDEARRRRLSASMRAQAS
ncbi:hypothetical protein [Bradyrhizobium nitroreducens]|uniref:hypothetical protein n=1 Tax=Bradyrhizobium nitroreducens TaxID=709803 RepID=UPI00157FB84C|nr:hypothetical protein [Bradyrhizobium nitroreducens]